MAGIDSLPHDIVQELISKHLGLGPENTFSEVSPPATFLVLLFVNKKFHAALRKNCLAWKAISKYRKHKNFLAVSLLGAACRSDGSISLVQWLSKYLKYPIDVNCCYAAAKGAHLPLLKWLKSEGVYPKGAWNPAALVAGGSPDLITWVIGDGDYSSLIYDALKHGNLELVQWLTTKSPPKDWTSSPLYANFAIRSGKVEVVEYALRNGAVLSDRHMEAAASTSLKMVKYLNESHSIPLGYSNAAAENGHIEVLQYLLLNGVHPLELDGAALQSCNIEVLQWVMDNGFFHWETIPASCFVAMLETAPRKKCIKMIKFLCTVDAEGFRSFMEDHVLHERYYPLSIWKCLTSIGVTANDYALNDTIESNFPDSLQVVKFLMEEHDCSPSGLFGSYIMCVEKETLKAVVRSDILNYLRPS